MIPNALISTGPYADLWSHIKSIDHALERVLSAGPGFKLTDLDKDRLQVLASHLRSDLPRESFIDIYDLSDVLTGSEFNIKHYLRDSHELKEWRKPSKIGFDEKISLLSTAITEYINQEGNLIDHVPHEEFHILRAALAILIIEAESALIS